MKLVSLPFFLVRLLVSISIGMRVVLGLCRKMSFVLILGADAKVFSGKEGKSAVNLKMDQENKEHHRCAHKRVSKRE